MPAIGTISRYELGAELARGGMGAVYRAFDRTLNREVAVKILLETMRDRPTLVQRFMEEAQIAGQLQHPGVPPVHDLGTLPNGSPFIAMKLIKGRTLAALLKERGNPSVDLPSYLHIFEQICQTLAYAHNKHVIHRDLKPSNVMVGAFGEVQVMDWGIAKVLTDSPATVGEPSAVGRLEMVSVVETDRSGNPDSATQAGSLLGTPAYMPPEQARGEINRLDPRSDVFSLGAILCEILTGRAPYVGTNEEVRAQATIGHLAPALERLTASGADPELLDLTRRCLAGNPMERPNDASAVAEIVARYRATVAHRLHEAQTQRAAAEARADAESKQALAERKQAEGERRRRRAQLLFGGAIVALMAMLGVVGWRLDRQATERRREIDQHEIETRRTVSLALDSADQALRRENPNDREADLALTQAALRLQNHGPEDLRLRLASLQRDLAMVKKLDRIMEARWTAIEGRFEVEPAQRDYPGAFTEYGLDVARERPEPIAEQISLSTIRERLVDGLEEWLDVDPDQAAVAQILRLVDPHPVRMEIRAALQSRNAKAVQMLVKGAGSSELTPALAIRLGGSPLLPTVERMRVLQAAWSQRSNSFPLLYRCGSVMYGKRGLNRPADAAAYYRAALAVRPDSAPGYCNLANALYDLGDTPLAIASYRRSIELDPKYATPHSSLGVLLAMNGEVDAGIELCRKAVELNAASSSVHNNLGVALKRNKDYDGAISSYRRALSLTPKDPAAHYNLGNALQLKRQFGPATEAYRKAIELDPGYVDAHTALGRQFWIVKKLEEAETHLRRALELDANKANAQATLAMVLRDKGERDGAITAFRRAIELDPTDAGNHYNLGTLYHRNGNLDDATTWYRRALEIDPNYASVHINLGLALKDKGQLDEAMACQRRALELNPKSVEAHNNLGQVYELLGDHDQAIDLYRKAIVLSPKSSMPHYNLANMLRTKGSLDEAMTSARRALDLDPKYASAYAAIGFILRDKSQFQESSAAFSKMLDLLPKQSPLRKTVAKEMQHNDQLGEALKRLPEFLPEGKTAKSIEEAGLFAELCHTNQRRYVAAVRFYHQAFATDATVALGRRGEAAKAAVLAAAGQGIDAGSQSPEQKAALRRQALEWLQADLATLEKQLASGTPKAKSSSRTTIHQWLNLSDLRSVRDEAALGALPATERSQWQAFWSDVRGKIKK